MMMIKQMIFLCVAAVHISVGDGAALPNLKLANEVINGAKGLVDLIKEFKNLVEDTTGINRLKEAIKQIDTKTEQLKDEERQILTNALKAYRQAEGEIGVMRLSLESLASETIKRTNTLLRIIQKLSPSDDEKTIQNKVKLVQALFIRLMERSKTLLAEAKVEYAQVRRTLTNVQTSLEYFEKSVQDLRNSESDRYAGSITAIRASLYTTAAYAGCTNPLLIASCPQAIAVAAAIAEPTVAAWKSSVKRLLRAIDDSLKETNGILGKILITLDQVKTEERIITRWRSDVEITSDLAGYTAELISAELKTELTDPLQGLVDTCKEFIKFVKAP
eukprot:TRINITY_DN1710_c0_g1_i2.p1 TRINITY_DN1710_c0_g1~~TRINITY_DN1710_c0_g1_i2.p1  ORF type:complete len:332 (-),score=47.92 TRINITY_DN1710_c0_g1_i2:177-1172(-)